MCEKLIRICLNHSLYKTDYSFRDYGLCLDIWFMDYVCKDFGLIPLNWEETRIKSLWNHNKFHEIISFKMISKISAKRKVNGLNIKEPCRRYFPWKFTRFWWVILDSVFKSSHPLSTFKINLLKKFGNIRWKHLC